MPRTRASRSSLPDADRCRLRRVMPPVSSSRGVATAASTAARSSGKRHGTAAQRRVKPAAGEAPSPSTARRTRSSTSPSGSIVASLARSSGTPIRRGTATDSPVDCSGSTGSTTTRSATRPSRSRTITIRPRSMPSTIRVRRVRCCPSRRRCRSSSATSSVTSAPVPIASLRCVAARRSISRRVCRLSGPREEREPIVIYY